MVGQFVCIFFGEPFNYFFYIRNYTVIMINIIVHIPGSNQDPFQGFGF